MNEKRLAKPRWNLKPKDVFFMAVEMLAFIGQVVLCFFFYNRAGLNWLLYLGWALLAIAFVLGWGARVAFEAKGRVPEGEDWLHTTAVVDGGIYALVRHPLFLSFMLMFLAFACISQHWLSALLSIISILMLHDDMRREERVNLDKFGDDYLHYMQKVPRINFVVGLIRLLQRR